MVLKGNLLKITRRDRFLNQRALSGRVENQEIQNPESEIRNPESELEPDK